jgi:hypothetical protein
MKAVTSITLFAARRDASVAFAPPSVNFEDGGEDADFQTAIG